MNFEKIELQGFKSFADKIEIVFDNGVTAIVGPNGCGKSNVADAIRWVLGEQSAKSLRGSVMQDVIFAGTQNRKSLSYCEVSLFFDNSKKIFSIENSQAVFTRKLYRSGESEYYINKQPCRLKDIISLLHECGLGKEGYTIIGQGKVEEILSSKPEDRRSIFEEAIGIAASKSLKLETERKIARTKDNLVRLSDISGELERQLAPLSKQANEAREYASLYDELKVHEINTYIYRHDNAEGAKEKINVRLKEFTEELNDKHSDLDRAQVSYERYVKEISEIDDTLSELHNKILNKTVGIEKLMGEAKIFGERINFYDAQIKRLTDENAELAKRQEMLVNSLTEKRHDKEEITKEIADINLTAEKINAELLLLLEELSKDEEGASTARERVLLSMEDLSSANEDISSIRAEVRTLDSHKNEILGEISTLRGKKSEMVKDNKTNLDISEELEMSLSDADNDLMTLERDLKNATNSRLALDREIMNLNSSLAVLEANTRFLRGLKDSFEGYQVAVKKLLTLSKDDQALVGKVKGVVAGIVTTEQKYETAIETALGGAIQNIVTDNPDDAKYLVNYLKQKQIGRITFLPVSSVKVRNLTPQIINAKNSRGSLGFATELVKYDKYYENIVSYLLGNTLVCDNIDNAVEIAKRYNFAFKIVTLDGDMLSPQGSVTGGYKFNSAVNLLATDRKIDQSERDLQAKNGEYNKKKKEQDELIKEIQSLTKKTEDKREAKSKIISQIDLFKQKIDLANKELTSVAGDIALKEEMTIKIEERIKALKNKEATVLEQSKEIIRSKQTAGEMEESHRSAFEALRDRKDKKVKENTDAQVRIAALNSELSTVISDIERAEGEIVSADNQTAANERSILNAKLTIEDLKLQAEKTTLSEADKSEVDILRANLAEKENRKKALSVKMQAADQSKRDLAVDIAALNDKKYGEEIALNKIDTDLEYISERIWEEYQATYDNSKHLMQEDYNVQKGAQEINRLKRKIAALGSINPKAIEFYNETNERYQELMKQKDDLDKALADLNTVLADLTTDMLETFNTGFAQIAQNFTLTFKQLFGGGNARLYIDQKEGVDPLDAGIEVEAQPPGKKLQNISLLSGGERSLTAIAILFAILKLRPMPFCVLDEIEAALDEANVVRFAEYLKVFSGDTQFIVITHKKQTMELADSLYGVTMEEKGVSKIVSVKLADIDEKAVS